MRGGVANLRSAFGTWHPPTGNGSSHARQGDLGRRRRGANRDAGIAPRCAFPRTGLDPSRLRCGRIPFHGRSRGAAVPSCPEPVDPRLRVASGDASPIRGDRENLRSSRRGCRAASDLHRPARTRIPCGASDPGVYKKLIHRGRGVTDMNCGQRTTTRSRDERVRVVASRSENHVACRVLPPGGLRDRPRGRSSSRGRRLAGKVRVSRAPFPARARAPRARDPGRPARCCLRWRCG